MSDRLDVQAEQLGHHHPAVYGTEQEISIYYDETNNIRKLRLSENGLNVDKYDNFVLGGIFLLPGQSIGDIHELRKHLQIQDSAKEIKSDLVAKGNFEKALDSNKLTKMLKWLLERNVGIHYINVNILNWTILEIIESIVANDAFRDELSIHRELKNELYRFATSDLPKFLNILHNYHYPDIPRAQTSQFIHDVRAFIQANWPIKPTPVAILLNDILVKASSLKELVFLADEKRGLLIDGFENFFLNRICTFKNSKHIFDEEKEVQKVISRFRIMNGTREMDYVFMDSKEVPEIQISDVIVGLLGKYFTFIEKKSFPTLMRIRETLTSTQVKNLGLLGDLISMSDAVSNNLIFRITTLDSDWKSDAFLFGKKPPPHLLNDY